MVCQMPISAARFSGRLPRSFARGVHAEVELIRSREATTVPSHPPGSWQDLYPDGEVAQSSVLGSPNREFWDLAWVFDDRAFRLEGDSLGHIGVGKHECKLLLEEPPLEDNVAAIAPDQRLEAIVGIAERDGFRL